ncbi:MAG: alanine racemase [Clostridia bacterium]|nr:alanine racemase [Clostridia bacterium]
MNNKKVISQENLIHNFNVCQKAFSNLCVMVKANGYGHGAKVIVRALKSKASFFGVATAKEAIELRKAFSDINILVVGKATRFDFLIKNNISFAVDSLNEIKIAEQIAIKHTNIAKIHIKINTGMNRLGTKSLNEFLSMLNYCNTSKNIILEGVFTHVFDADCNTSHFYEQMQEFYCYVKHINNPNVIIHIGGSFVLKHKVPSFVNMVRVGYFVYGYGKKGLKPVMTVCSRVIKVTNCKAGEFVGYGKTKLKHNSKIAVVGMGYADGLMRRLSNEYFVNINGRLCKIVGNICMDMFMVDVSNASVRVGDKVIVLDNAEQMAKTANTSAYEILTAFNLLR